MSLVNRTLHLVRAKFYRHSSSFNTMPFHLHTHSSTTKYPLIQYQKLHEYEYGRFIKTLQARHSRSINVAEENILKNRSISSNNNHNNYMSQRQINLQYRQDKRKAEYERIQKENLKFSEKLMHAKAFLNRYDQQIFFDKHCKLKQRLQRYPSVLQTKTKPTHLPFLRGDSFKADQQPFESTFLIDNGSCASHQSNRSREKCLKTRHRLPNSKDLLLNTYQSEEAEKKLSSLTKHHARFSKTLPPISSTIHQPVSKRHNTKVV